MYSTTPSCLRMSVGGLMGKPHLENKCIPSLYHHVRGRALLRAINHWLMCVVCVFAYVLAVVLWLQSDFRGIICFSIGCIRYTTLSFIISCSEMFVSDCGFRCSVQCLKVVGCRLLTRWNLTLTRTVTVFKDSIPKFRVKIRLSYTAQGHNINMQVKPVPTCLRLFTVTLQDVLVLRAPDCDYNRQEKIHMRVCQISSR